MMNERINELAKQTSYIWHTSGDPQIYEFTPEKLEKFAELIVQECIDCVRGAVLADDVALRNNLGFSDGIAQGVVHIQKHFGVK